MKYMALIYTEPASEADFGTPEFQAMMQGYFDFNTFLKEKGALVFAEALQGIETATSLRIRAGKTETMDGPYAETREHLGGFYIMDVPDLDTALRYAAMIPGAHHGTVEVRPLMNYDPAGN